MTSYSVFYLFCGCPPIILMLQTNIRFTLHRVSIEKDIGFEKEHTRKDAQVSFRGFLQSE